MKSRILRKNVRQSIRRSQSGGGKTYEFPFLLTTNMADNLKAKHWSHIRLEITVKKPKEKSFFSKERKEYLFDVKVYSDPLIERFARFNKKNLTRNELVLLFFENYNLDDIIDVGFIKKVISELRFMADAGSWDPDKIYLNGLYSLVVGLKETLEPYTAIISERYAADAKKKADEAKKRADEAKKRVDEAKKKRDNLIRNVLIKRDSEKREKNDEAFRNSLARWQRLPPALTKAEIDKILQ